MSLCPELLAGSFSYFYRSYYEKCQSITWHFVMPLGLSMSPSSHFSVRNVVLCVLVMFNVIGEDIRNIFFYFG